MTDLGFPGNRYMHDNYAPVSILPAGGEGGQTPGNLIFLKIWVKFPTPGHQNLLKIYQGVILK
jgi:hypothetical protein